MTTGTVKWFSDDKGFGFHQPPITAPPAVIGWHAPEMAVISQRSNSSPTRRHVVAGLPGLR
jgi:'Cold-shock' DNA-binding domain